MLIAAALAMLAGFVAVLLINTSVMSTGKKFIKKHGDFTGSHTAIVLGAYVDPDGRLCDMLADRVDTAVDLYRSGKVEKILMTGDHGLSSYDEVNGMRKYAQARGVPARDIFMDHAGFSTYDSMFRAREVFRVESAVVITQDFHLPRAVYTARKLGLEAVGLSADRHAYPESELQAYNLREILARTKAFAQLAARAKPRFLGEAIPVSGDGRATHDRED